MSDNRVRLQQVERILDISRELTSTVALEPLLHKIVEVAAELTEGEAASILLLNSRTGELRFRAASGDAGVRLFDIPVPVADSIAGAVLLSGEPAVIVDARADPRHYGAVGKRVGLEIRSLLAVPLCIKERRIGVLEVVNRHGGSTFSEQDVETLTTLAGQAAVSIENARLVEDLRRAYERLGELDRLKSDFIAIASHELRTPLGLIMLYAAMLREQMGDESAQELDAVLRAAMRLRHIIETMLNLRYLQTGEMSLDLERFDLCREVQGACDDYGALVQADGVVLAAEFPSGGVPVVADREKVRVMLDNLISNAVKFTPPGGRVKVSLTCGGDVVEMSVVDSGMGIPAEEMGQIFEPFYQVEDHMTRRHGGMGLGLSIVRGLAELHGGSIEVKSAPGQGSRFVVSLPIDATGVAVGMREV